MSLALANRYARALADVVLAPGSGVDGPTALQQVRAFSGLLQESADLKTVLMSPAVPLARKRAVAGSLAAKLDVSGPVRNFLFVVIDHRRISQVGQMADALETALDERLGRVHAGVRSAAAMSESQQQALAAELSQLTGKKVRCEFSVDPELLGGVSVRVGSTIYDGSVRGRLNDLRHRMRAD